MEKVRRWGESELTLEENSDLGKVVSYFIKHYDGLTAFYYSEGCELDNNKAK